MVWLSMQLINLRKTQNKIEGLIRQRERNINLANQLKEILELVENKDKDWKSKVKEAEENFNDDIIEALSIIGRCRAKTSENYQGAMKLINARISNLETNLHIEIDMERIEDRSKALSYIGIEVAEALKAVPTPAEDVEEVLSTIPVENEQQEEEKYVQETTFEVKPTLWQRFKNSKFVKGLLFVFRAKVVLQMPALPEGRDNQNK